MSPRKSQTDTVETEPAQAGPASDGAEVAKLKREPETAAQKAKKQRPVKEKLVPVDPYKFHALMMEWVNKSPYNTEDMIAANARFPVSDNNITGARLEVLRTIKLNKPVGRGAYEAIADYCEFPLPLKKPKDPKVKGDPVPRGRGE